MSSTNTINEHIRRIELYTRRLLSSTLIGSSRSAQKGVGFDFDQLRDYTIGDDPRIIDWFGSARSQRLLVKQYQEERNRTILLVVDGSRSMQFGLENKFERAAWVAGIIAMVGGYGADKVGLIVYTNEVECYVPPRVGIAHVRSLIQRLYTHVPRTVFTDLRPVLKIVGGLKERSMVFVISDCIDQSMTATLRMMRKHDLLVIRCSDERESSMPPTGICVVQDFESGTARAIYLGSQGVRVIYNELTARVKAEDNALKGAGVTLLPSIYKETFIRDLLVTMRRRMRY